MQEPYIRSRENPLFDGILSKGDQVDPFKIAHIQSKTIEHEDNTKHPESEADHDEKPLRSPIIITHIEKTYTVTRRKEMLSNIMLPLSAASYYNGVSPQVEIVESCQSFDKLNAFLKARKDDVNAGVPGKFLHVVLGSDDAGNFFFLKSRFIL